MGNEVSQSADPLARSSHNGASRERIKKLRKRIVHNHVNVSDFVVPTFPKTDKDISFLEETLTDNFLFECFHESERKQVIDALQEETFERGIDVVKQGDDGDYFYIIAKGRVTCFVDGVESITLTKGACFGELSLLYNVPRAATCRTANKVSVWKIDHKSFVSILAHGDKKERDAKLAILKKISFLTSIDDARLNKIADAMVPLKVAKDTRIIEKGEVGKRFYIIKEGSVKIHDIGTGESDYEDTIISSGEYFGQLALESGEPRKAFVTAITDCSMLYLRRNDFDKLVGSYANLLRWGSRREVLHAAPVFATSQLEAKELDSLAYLFEEKSYGMNRQLVKIGDSVTNQSFCIIEEGKIRITTDKGIILELKKGDYFGGTHIKHPKGYISDRSVIALKPTKLAVLSKENIESIIFSTDRLGNPDTFEHSVEKKLAVNITISDLHQYRIIGKGFVSTVRLAVHRTTDKPYAIKIFSKKNVIDKKLIDCLIREKNIAASFRKFPFIENLVNTFQDSQNIYFLFDFIHGGEMHNVIYNSKEKIVKGQPEAVFYSACILLCLVHLSDRDICYRDLKPRNVLIDRKGYCRLIDFGEAKVVSDKTRTVCGSPEYMAPEMILCKGHNCAVDFWSFGIFIYTLLAAKTPFYSEQSDSVALFKKIVKVKYAFPDDGSFTDQSKDIVKQLLVKKESERLGCLADGARGIMKHVFFEMMDWQELYSKQKEAPWIPKVKGDMDPSNFDEYEEMEAEQDMDDNLTDEEQALFEQL